MSGGKVVKARKKRTDSADREESGEESGATVFSHHLLGNVQIPEICFFSLGDRCEYRYKGCKRLHAKCPVQWQFEKDENWYNFPQFHSKELESSYQDANNNGITLTVIDDVKLHESLSDLLEILGEDLWSSDFISMTLENESTSEIFDIRRLSTHSSVVSKSKIATVYHWYYKSDQNKWLSFGSGIEDSEPQHELEIKSEDVETQYVLHNIKTFTVTGKSSDYKFDFSRMTLENLSRNEVEPIRRRPKFVPKKQTLDDSFEMGNFPPYWAPMAEDKLVFSFVLQPSEQEYIDIAAFFRKTLFNSKIVEIKRHQNPNLWNAYLNKKSFILKKNKNSDLNEMRLFHGTHPDNVPTIVENNLDWRMHGSNVGQKYGQGTYFTTSAWFADHYSKVPEGTAKTILLVKVLVGSYTQGHPSMVTPPLNSETGVNFDSTVDNGNSPKTYVKYDSQEYYPEYSIHYLNSDQPVTKLRKPSNDSKKHQQNQVQSPQHHGNYGSPAAGYGSPAAGYGSPAAGYSSPAAGYSSPAAGYSSPAAGYSSPAAGYGITMQHFMNHQQMYQGTATYLPHLSIPRHPLFRMHPPRPNLQYTQGASGTGYPGIQDHNEDDSDSNIYL